MNSRTFSLILATGVACLFFGCSHQITASLPQASATTEVETAEVSLSNQDEASHSKDLSWLSDADPKADANLAIEKQDFTLLAFAGRVTTFPGIASETAIVQQKCGVRLLATSSDTLKSENDLQIRKKLHQYAATFNQLVAAACQKNK